MVTLVSAPGCQPCRLTKRFLTDRGIAFQERNVADDPEALDLVKNLGYQSAPVVISGEQHWSGFRPDKLETLAA